MHLISEYLKLQQQLAFVSLGSTLLLGGAFYQALRTARRKASLEPRLRAFTKGTPNTHLVMPSLRRALPRRRTPSTTLLLRLDASLAATGNKIGIGHLLVAAMLADVTICFAAAITQTPPP
jgi:hypothetical protein